jgi:hypothetical protein
MHVNRSVNAGFEVVDACANMANVVANAGKIGLEKYPRQESRSIQYGTAGFRTR